jgi:ATP-dependent Clp protease ATP-binding subunit ClpC
MFERYTERARRVIVFARYEASVFGSSSIDTQHLLLGLLREGGGVTGQILARGQVSHEGVRKEVEARGAPPGPTPTSVDIPLAPEALRTLQHAAEEARRMNTPYIGTEHLLLGLLHEQEGLAAGILGAKGLRLEDLREEVRLLSQAREGPARPREAFPKLADFLAGLDERRAAYHVAAFRREAIRVEVAVPEERWVATFFADGRVAVEVFEASGSVQDEAALARLLDRLGPPRPAEG